jgi:p-cumate 2,3-dioxygenase subunit beta
MPDVDSAMREALEQFLYHEAELLDAWNLKSWLVLFTSHGRYLVPSLDLPNAEPSESLYLIDDDHLRLTSRAHQLLDHFAFAESPHSRTHRSITNVMFDNNDDGTISLRANFIINRFRHELQDVYVGRYRHILVRESGQLKFKIRKAILDHEALRPHGKISIIV